MGFRVEIAEPAADDIDDAVAYIAADSIEAAAKWITELQTLIMSLAEMPTRFAVIPESKDLKHTYRQVVHYSHRVIYRIDLEEKIVYVVRVYHGNRHPIRLKDIRG